jgi:hypothetical protein
MASNKKDLKAYVRYDGTGRLISGSLILQRSKPKVGNWKQIGAYECCDPSCLPPVYGEDYIIDDIVSQPNGVVVVIETNPITNPILQVAAISCESEPPGRIITLDVTTVAGNIYYYFIPENIMEQTCAIGFRRICDATVSGWDFGFGG